MSNVVSVRDTLEQALEALINSNSLILATDDVANVVRAGNNETIAALKRAIEERTTEAISDMNTFKQQGEPVRCNPADYCACQFQNLYTSAPAIPEDVENDAARYRWIRENGDEIIAPDRGLGPEWVYGYELDAEIDAAILSAAPKGE